MCAASTVVGGTSSIEDGAADIVSKSSSDHETVALSAAGEFPVECICPMSGIFGRLPEASIFLGATCLAAKAIIG